MRLLPPAIDSGYVTSFDGTTIYWEQHGPRPSETSKRPMLFCYGLVCSMNQWRLQLERYSKEHPCILFDYRGHHQSQLPSDMKFINLSALAKDASAVLHKVAPGKKVHVWGHSMGCNVALELALAEPDLVKSLVLCCGTPDNPFNNMFGSNLPAMIAAPMFEIIDDFPAPFVKAWDLVRKQPLLTQVSAYLAGFNRDTSTRDDIAAYAEAVCSVKSETFLALLHDMSRGNTRAILPKIHTPTLVVAGALDRVTPPSEQKMLFEGLPKGPSSHNWYIEIPAGSHNVQLDFAEYLCMKVEHVWNQNNLM